MNFRQSLVGFAAAAGLLLVFVLLLFAGPSLRTGHSAWFPRDRVALLPIHGVILSDEAIEVRSVRSELLQG